MKLEVESKDDKLLQKGSIDDLQVGPRVQEGLREKVSLELF